MCAQLSVDDRRSRGAEAAAQVPLQAHRGWATAPGRRSPVGVLADQEDDRLSDLVPVRHGRMMVSPFTFYRGAAAVMAEDLGSTPVAGLPVQLCGDAHLSNFGVFGSPERRLVFDLNDFDETLPGPFEYDVKRMVTSFVIAARDNGFPAADGKAVARDACAAYRTAMAEFAGLGTMDVWYASLDEDRIKTVVQGAIANITKAQKSAKTAKEKKLARKEAKQAKKAAKTAAKAGEKAHTRDSLQALSKLGEQVGGQYRIVSQPPVVVPLRELAFDMAPDVSPERIEAAIRDQFAAYRATLQPDLRHLLEQFEMVDAARKVVGVGSVGTRAYIVLLQGRDASDPLFLQVKEATSSVLETQLPRSRYRQHGQRVVQGQRLMQAASDIYLGWTRGPRGRDFYWRQLRDMKGSAAIEAMTPLSLGAYARLCGWTLARAHARSGDPVAIAAYLGTGDAFDRAMTDFAVRYADQNERDYTEFTAAVKAGELAAVEGV
ncbi:MAG TPA: DUF2252 domain-containing protein [Trebonia sp.]|jgi:uncharacterized protein (DUF2252 family)|nr:DUF2252 domain-containing protein [Trebonia sp.]